jgi:hypothetical protein
MKHTDLVGHALSRKSAPAQKHAKTVRHMHITKAKGGYHVRHEYDHPSHEPTEHVVAGEGTDALQDHVAQNFSEPAAAGQAQPEPEAGE